MFGMPAIKTPTYPIICRFPLFVALCDRNPPNGTDRQTDGQTVLMFLNDLLLIGPSLVYNFC